MACHARMHYAGLLESLVLYEGVLALVHILYNQAQCIHLRCWKWQIQCQRSSCQVGCFDSRATAPPRPPPRGCWGLASCLRAHSHPSAAQTTARNATMHLVEWTARQTVSRRAGMFDWAEVFKSKDCLWLWFIFQLTLSQACYRVLKQGNPP